MHVQKHIKQALKEAKPLIQINGPTTKTGIDEMIYERDYSFTSKRNSRTSITSVSQYLFSCKLTLLLQSKMRFSFFPFFSACLKYIYY